MEPTLWIHLADFLFPQDHWAIQQGAGGLCGQQDWPTQDWGDIVEWDSHEINGPSQSWLKIVHSQVWWLWCTLHWPWLFPGGEEVESDDLGQEVPGDSGPGDWCAHYLHQGVQVIYFVDKFEYTLKCFSPQKFTTVSRYALDLQFIAESFAIWRFSTLFSYDLNIFLSGTRLLTMWSRQCPPWTRWWIACTKPPRSSPDRPSPCELYQHLISALVTTNQHLTT